MKVWPLLSLCAIAACTSGPSPIHGPTGWTRVDLRYATHCQIWRHGEERLLLVFGPGGTRDTAGIYYCSNAEGSAAPLPNAVRLPALERVALASTTHVPFLSTLGCANAVVACAHLDQVRDTTWLDRIRSGAIAEIGTGDGVDRERLLALHVGALFDYPFGHAGRTVGHGGPPVVQVCEYLEEDPLGRAEWLRFFGSLFHAESRADSLFDTLVSHYEHAKQEVPTDATRPTVFFGSSWKGEWSVPPGNSYMARLLADAGGQYLFADRTSDGNLTLKLETVVQEGARAEVWGRILAQPAPVRESDIAGDDDRILQLPAFTHHRCFAGNSLETDLFGAAVLQPDVMLEDLIMILHPGMGKGRVPVYFKPVQ